MNALATASISTEALTRLVIKGLVSTDGRKELAPRQLAVLLITDTPQTVRGMAAKLNVNKPAITRALDALEERGFVQRRADPKDRRSIFVNRTTKGIREIGRIVRSGDLPN